MALCLCMAQVAHDGIIDLFEAVGFLLLHVLYICIVLTLPKV